MEAVGARQGRLSSRYGVTTVFTGPVRKWMKNWIHVAPPSSNGGVARQGGGNRSNMMLFKWTPIMEKEEGGDGIAMVGDGEERVRKKLKFVPIALLEEQKNEAAEHTEDENGTKVTQAGSIIDVQISKNTSVDEKPDMNDIPMEDNEELGAEGEHVERQDLNKTVDEGNISQSKTDEE